MEKRETPSIYPIEFADKTFPESVWPEPLAIDDFLSETGGNPA